MKPEDILPKAERCMLERIRVWWRPMSCIGIAGGLLVNAIYLPLATGTPISLTDFAAAVTACAAAFAVREWGKLKGGAA